MKRSEQLFSIINDIDDDIIDEAKIKEEAPVLMKPEPRSPIKGIIALAACIAVLAVGIFAIVKFKLGREMDPIQSDPSEYSSDSSESSNSSESNGEYTAEDIELQEMLKELAPRITDIDKMFSDMYFKGSDSYDNIKYGADEYNYYFIPDGKTTGPNHLIEVPHTRAEMEALLLEYFTKESVEKYLSDITVADGAVDSNGKKVVKLPNKDDTLNRFVEFDGRLYYYRFYYEISQFSSRMTLYYIVPETARVISKTDDMIKFSFKADYIFNHQMNGKPNDHAECTLRYERGGWRLEHYYGDNYGLHPFWEDPSEDNPTKTDDRSEDDKELQKILKELVTNAEEIHGMFNFMSTYGEPYSFRIDETTELELYRIPEDQRTEPTGIYAIPQTYDGMRELLLTAFTKNAADKYMELVGKGSAAENPDGTFSFKYDEGYEKAWPTFVEIDGKMYRTNGRVGRDLGIDIGSASVTRKTDDIIEFTYEYIDSYGNTSGVEDGFIINEGGGWKLNYYDHLRFQPIFTEEDLELQAILAELAPGGELIAGWVGYGCYDPDHTYRFKFSDSDEYGSEFDLIPVGKASDSGIEYPRTCEELETLMLKYLTQEIVDGIMTGVCKGTMTENPDGTYTVVVESEPTYHNFIEIDGRLYVEDKARGGAGVPVWDSAKIIEKNDSYIKFTYFHDYIAGYNQKEGLIKYERGSWRLSYNWRGFVLDNE